MRRLYLVFCLTYLAGCENGREPGAGTPADSTSDSFPTGEELIPAEWTVAEDTASDGEITTASLQLPSAREIAHLLPDQSSRLILRCIDRRVAAYIEATRSLEPDSSPAHQVAIQLDSAPSCE